MTRDATPKRFRKIFRLGINLKIITTFIINTSIYSMLAQHGPGFLQKQLLVLFCLILTTTPEAISYYYSCFRDWGVRDITGLKPALDHTNKRQQMQDLNSNQGDLRMGTFPTTFQCFLRGDWWQGGMMGRTGKEKG